ncbi:hypothetical protein COBT_001499 [Conglomerata obtusa]
MCVFTFIKRVRCSDNIELDENKHKYLTYGSYKLYNTLYISLRNEEAMVREEQTRLQDAYKLFKNTCAAVVSFENTKLLDLDGFIVFMNNLLSSKFLISTRNAMTNENYLGNYKFHAQYNKEDYKYTNDSQSNDFHKFFMRFYSDSYKNAHLLEDYIYITETTTIVSSNNGNETHMKNALLEKKFRKKIIFDDCCNLNKTSYEILFKLLYCAFLHKPNHPNFLIFTIKNFNHNEINNFEDELLKIFKIFGSGCKNIFYTRMIEDNDIYNIRMRMTAVNTHDKFKTQKFYDVEEFVGNSNFYKMYPKSVNTTYSIEYYDIGDRVDMELESMCLDKDQFKLVRLMMNTLNASYDINFFSKISINENEIQQSIKIINISNENNNKTFIILTETTVIYDWIDKGYHQRSDGSYNAEIFFRYINYYLYYNPFFEPITPFICNITENNLTFTSNQGNFFYVNTEHNKITNLIAIMLNTEDLFNHKTSYALLQPFKKNSLSELIFNNYFPYEINEGYYSENPDWKYIKHLSELKISELLYHSLVIKGLFNNSKFEFYIKIENDNLFCVHSNCLLEKITELKNRCENYVYNRLLNKLKMKFISNDEYVVLNAAIKPLTELIFTNYNNIDHFLCTSCCRFRHYHIKNNILLHYAKNLNIGEESEYDNFEDENYYQTFLAEKNKLENYFDKNFYIDDPRCLSCIGDNNSKNEDSVIHAVIWYRLSVYRLYKEYEVKIPDFKLLLDLFCNFYYELFNEAFYDKQKNAKKLNYKISIFFPNSMLMDESNKIMKVVRDTFSDYMISLSQ